MSVRRFRVLDRLTAEEKQRVCDAREWVVRKVDHPEVPAIRTALLNEDGQCPLACALELDGAISVFVAKVELGLANRRRTGVVAFMTYADAGPKGTEKTAEIKALFCPEATP